MQKEVIFPTAEEITYLVNIKVSNNSNLSKKDAEDMVILELLQVKNKSCLECFKTH